MKKKQLTTDQYPLELARLILTAKNVSIVHSVPPDIISEVMEHLVNIALGDEPTLNTHPQEQEFQQQQAAWAVCAILADTKLHMASFVS